MNTPSFDDARVNAERVQRLARWLDAGLRVPGTQIRFGVEAVLGLIPVAGDAVGLLLSLWLIELARRAGAPAPLLWRMAANAALDAGAGALPLIGDVFDLLFKANSRNAELLRQHFEPDEKAPQRSASLRWIGVLLTVIAVFFWWWWRSAS